MAYQERDMSYQEQVVRASEQQEVSGWAVGFSVFAGVLMIMAGAFQFIQGLAAVINDDFFVIGREYAFDLDVSTWGWIHLVIGAIVALAGIYIFTGNLLARIIGISLALVSAITNFFYIPYYPVWSLLIIAICIGVIWGLASMGRDRAME